MSALDPEDVEAVAEAVVRRLREAGLVTEPAPRYLTTAEVAQRLGLSADWVRRNRARLGATRLSGPRGPLRFDPVEVESALSERKESGPDGSSSGNGTAPPRRRRRRASDARPLPLRSTDPADLPERTGRRARP